MILHSESPEARNVAVFLDGKPIRYFIKARDGADGWVEILDPTEMAPLFIDEGEGDEPPPSGAEDIDLENDDEKWVPLATKTLKGHVEFKRLGTQK